MTLNRREFLRLAGLVAGGATVSACSPIYRQISRLPQLLPAGLSVPPLTAHEHLVLSRLSYGPTVEERWQVSDHGWQAWVEMQLAPSSISDEGVEWRTCQLESLRLEADALVSWDREDVTAELQRGATVRRIYSNRQLYERMVEFWTDHFNVSIHKGDCWFLKTIDDREVIRRHALGSFPELLRASAHSPAMLIYLDNQANQSAAPNENYARELMELHTLGVEGGYSQTDVMELARCLTGWTVKNHFWRGEFEFQSDYHDPGSKRVLGLRIEPAGQGEAEQLLDWLALHPSTAQHLSTKLIRRFVTEDPPPALVERAASTFVSSAGSIPATLRTILFDGLERPGTKLKRPVDYVSGALRILSADTDGGQPIQQLLAEMGQPLFEWPTPDGPPDRAEFWAGNLLPRWRFAIDLARDQIAGTRLQVPEWQLGPGPSVAFDQLSALLLGVPPDPDRRDRVLEALQAGGRPDEPTTVQLILAGLLASPGFQYL